MNYQIIENKSKISVQGLSVELTKSQKENFTIIRKHWQYFNKELQKRNLNSNDSNWKKYAITYKKDNRYFYLTGILKKDSEVDFESIEINEGNFARFKHKGNIDIMRDTISDIYKNIIPNNSELKINKNRTLIHFEYYNYRFHWTRFDSIIDIYVPLIR